MNKCSERLYNGLVKENPTFVQMLGMCPTLAVTSSAINGAGMGLATTCILVLSNFMISLLRKVIPDKVRIPSFIVIIASFVTIIQFLMEAYVPALNKSLGIYIPLIVVNCIILGRAESYASKNKPLPSIFDGIGMGLGFTVGLTVIGAFRELVGKGCVFGYQILGDGNLLEKSSGIVKAIGKVFSLYTPITIFVLAPGAFFVLAFIIAFINHRNSKKVAAGEVVTGCKPESCAGCTNTMCGGKLIEQEPNAEIGTPLAAGVTAATKVKEMTEAAKKEEEKQTKAPNLEAEKTEEKKDQDADKTVEEKVEETPVAEEAKTEEAQVVDEEKAEEAPSVLPEKQLAAGNPLKLGAVMNNIAKYNKLHPGEVKPVDVPENEKEEMPETPVSDELSLMDEVLADIPEGEEITEDAVVEEKTAPPKNKKKNKKKKGKGGKR